MPVGATRFVRRPALVETEALDDNLYRITAHCAVAVGREWLAEDLLPTLIQERAGEGLLVHGPIVTYLDENAQRSFARAIRTSAKPKKSARASPPIRRPDTPAMAPRATSGDSPPSRPRGTCPAGRSPAQEVKCGFPHPSARDVTGDSPLSRLHGTWPLGTGGQAPGPGTLSSSSSRRTFGRALRDERHDDRLPVRLALQERGGCSLR